MHKPALLCLLLTVVGLTAQLQASLVTVDFAAQVTSLNAEVWDSSVFVGAIVYGTHTFDDSVGYRQVIQGPIDIELSVGNYTLVGIDEYFVIVNNDIYGGTTDSCGLTMNALEINGPEGTRTGGAKLVVMGGSDLYSSTDLANWPQTNAPGELTISVGSPMNIDLAADLLWITPEPAGAAMMVAVAATLLPRRRGSV